MTEMTKLTMPRWTIRAVDPAIIGRVQSIQDQTGASLGEIVSLAIAHGLRAARTELARRQPRHPNKHSQGAAQSGRGQSFFDRLAVYGSGGMPRLR